MSGGSNVDSGEMTRDDSRVFNAPLNKLNSSNSIITSVLPSGKPASVQRRKNSSMALTASHLSIFDPSALPNQGTTVTGKIASPVLSTEN